MSSNDDIEAMLGVSGLQATTNLSGNVSPFYRLFEGKKIRDTVRLEQKSAPGKHESSS